jgi:hypothetical protein
MKKKRNKKAIIITAIVMFIGILLVLAGFFGGWFVGLFYKDLDYKNITPADMGKQIETDIQVYYDNIDVPDKTLQLLGGLNSDDYKFIILDLSYLSEEDKETYYDSIIQHITIKGTLRAVDDEEYQEVTGALFELYDYRYYERLEQAEAENGENLEAEFPLEQYHDYLRDSVIPYCIEVKSISTFNWIPFIPAGVLVFIIALILEICLVFKFKKRIVLPIVYGLMVIVPAIMFWNHIRTILTINKVADGFYTMKNYECTDTMGLLASNSQTSDDVFNWIFDKHLYGAPNVFSIDDDSVGFGCATFAAVTPEGDHIFGRNFDLMETDTLLVYSHPDGCYESIGVTGLSFFGTGENAQVDPDSALGKFVMVITPYLVLDGMNEKGVAAGILQVNIDEPHQNNGKPDLPVYVAIRGILDTCASVDEALALLESYDIHSDLGNYHLFITDRSGRYVVVEWLDNEMVVTEYPYCTNSVIAPGKYYDMGDPDNRISTIDENLGPSLIATEQEAMDILDKVHNKMGLTEWSCVYNLDDFTVSICLDADFGTSYTFSVTDFA